MKSVNNLQNTKQFFINKAVKIQILLNFLVMRVIIYQFVII